MPVIFDGAAHAKPILDNLADRVRDLKANHELTPHLVVFMIGSPPGGEVYTERKKKAAKAIGAKFTLVQFPDSAQSNELVKSITEFNTKKDAHGIMIQLPLPKPLQKSKSRLLNTISNSKDVDGLRDSSEFTHPTSLAILDIVENSLITNKDTKILLIGSQGFVGHRTLQLIKSHSYNVLGVDIETKDLASHTKKADIIISTTGKPNLIDNSMIKDGVNIIDIGYPKGDMHKNVIIKAKFVTPIKNGVGPLTIAYLLENLVSATYNTLTTHT